MPNCVTLLEVIIHQVSCSFTNNCDSASEEVLLNSCKNLGGLKTAPTTMVSKGLLTFVVISAFVLLCNGAVLKNGQSRGSEETDDWSYECDAYWCDDDDGLRYLVNRSHVIK